MDYVGSIQFSSDQAAIDRDAWLSLIKSHPSLVAPESQRTINPFTLEPMVVHPSESSAMIVVDGQNIGALQWPQDNDDNLLVVFGDPVVQALAIEIAELFGGSFVPVE
jgi:hypothetical protein